MGVAKRDLFKKGLGEGYAQKSKRVLYVRYTEPYRTTIKTMVVRIRGGLGIHRIPRHLTKDIPIQLWGICHIQSTTCLMRCKSEAEANEFIQMLFWVDPYKVPVKRSNGKIESVSHMWEKPLIEVYQVLSRNPVQAWYLESFKIQAEDRIAWEISEEGMNYRLQNALPSSSQSGQGIC